MPKTYNDLYIGLWQRLRDAGIEAHTLEARFLTAAAAGKTVEELLRDLRLYASDEIEARLEGLALRRLAGEPAAYVTGTWGFYGLEFRVTPDTLIPRMDTEVLVAKALESLRGRGEDARILDLCTGSGCVGLTLARLLPRSRVVLLDNSAPALTVAAENARRLSLDGRAETALLDVKAPPPAALGSFDCITANPPYIPTGLLPELDASVTDYEPLAALDGGADGLDFYRSIAARWLPALRQSGWLFAEVGEDQAAPVARLLRAAGLRHIGTEPDTLGVDRVVYGQM